MAKTAENTNGSQSGAMEQLMRSIGQANTRNSPVERWNPPHCGMIDIRINSDGSWHYMGSPIGRLPLIKLFASVLRKDGDDYVLVTPVEKLGIRVDEAPFQAVEMAVEGEGAARQIAFRTNVDDLVNLGPENKMRFVMGRDGSLKPYVHVRRDLWARVTRALAYDVMALGEVLDVDGTAMFGVWAGAVFHAALPACEIDGLT